MIQNDKVYPGKDNTKSEMIRDRVSISVVIPTLGNRSSLLFEAVASVVNQENADFELIVVVADPENYQKVVSEVGARARVIVADSHLGAAQARNLGASKAKHDYFAFLDDDDFWDGSYLNNLSKEILIHDCQLWIGSLYSFDSSSQLKKRTRAFTLNDLYLFNPGVTGSNIVITKSLFWALGGFSASLSVSQDKALVLEALKLGEEYVLVDGAKAFSRNHAGKRLTNPISQLNGYLEFYNEYRKEMPTYVCKQLEKKILGFAKDYLSSCIWKIGQLNVLGLLMVLLRYKKIV